MHMLQVMHILRGMSHPPSSVSDSGLRIAPKPGAIAAYCESQGISRDEMSRRMGVSTVTAYRVDVGRGDPSPAFIAKLIDLTGLGFDDLFVIVGSAA